MNAPTGRKPSVKASDNAISLSVVKLLRDRRQRHNDGEEIERIQRPAEKTANSAAP